MHKIEMHFHTAESSPCGKVSARTSVKKYAESGYEGIVVTDHLSRNVYPDKNISWNEICEQFLKGYKTAQAAAEELLVSENKKIKIFLGMELRFSQNDNDFLVYGFNEKWLLNHPFIIDVDLKAFRKIAVEDGLVVVQAHPFRPECSPEKPKYLDGVEIFNFNPRHNSHNDLAKAFAEKNNLITSCGSDFHEEDDYCGAGLDFIKNPESVFEICSLFLKKNFKIIEAKNEFAKIK